MGASAGQPESGILHDQEAGERRMIRPGTARLHRLLVAGVVFLTPSQQARNGPTAFALACTTAHPSLQADFEAKAASYMSARARITGFSGAVLVARDGRPLFRRAYSLANREHDIPN